MSFGFRRKPGAVAKPRRKRGVYRSKFEGRFNEQVKELTGVSLGYETTVLPYLTSPQKKRYTPDWTIKEGWYLETKGRLDTANRQKILYIKQQHPTARILLVFQYHQNPIVKGSKTTYSNWCDKNGIEWCSIKDTEKWQAFIKEALAA
jgi:hypothetical protein